MALDDLYELVGELERRIAGEGGALRQSEALTRYALVDPLLRALGWDTADAKSVVPEYRSAAGVADYALFSGNGQPPAVIIEAKKLGEPLDDRVALQSLNYCNLVGTPYFALTDGKIWKIYATFEQAPLADRIIVEFAIGDMNAVEVCIKALALWRRSVDAGNVRTSSPILPLNQGGVTQVDPGVSSGIATPMPMPAASAPATPTPAPVIPAPQITHPARQSTPVHSSAASEWIPLSEYAPQAYERLSEIRFPDGGTVPVRNQKQIITEATRWLIRRGLLQPNNPAHCPIRGHTRYIISTGNVHPNGDAFTNPVEVEGVFIETKAGNMQTVRNTCKIITTVNQDPSAFMVKRAH